MNAANEPDSMRLTRFGLTVYAYRRSGAAVRWLLPVCAAACKERLQRLQPKNPGNWKEVDLDGCPTICYCMRFRQVRDLNKKPFLGAYRQLADVLGPQVMREYFYDVWLRYTNAVAKAKNAWEQHHGGIRAEKFNYGPSIREAARMSIT